LDNWGNDVEIRLVTFEPDPRSKITEHTNVDTHGDLIFNTGLGSVDETRTLYLTRKKEVSSLYKPRMSYLSLFPDSKRWDIVDKVEIDLMPLDNYRDIIGEIDLMKLDSQGSELDILKGSIHSLKGCLAIEVEVEFIELYEGQPLFGDISNFLLKHGFEFYDFLTEYRYGRKELNCKGQLAFADALFLRPVESLRNFSIDKIDRYISICKHYKKDDLVELALLLKDK
jgi:FkbM family methyltransferase